MAFLLTLTTPFRFLFVVSPVLVSQHTLHFSQEHSSLWDINISLSPFVEKLRRSQYRSCQALALLGEHYNYFPNGHSHFKCFAPKLGGDSGCGSIFEHFYFPTYLFLNIHANFMACHLLIFLYKTNTNQISVFCHVGPGYH